MKEGGMKEGREEETLISKVNIWFLHIKCFGKVGGKKKNVKQDYSCKKKVKLDSHFVALWRCCMGTADRRGSVCHGVRQPIITVIVMQDKQAANHLCRCDVWGESNDFKLLVVETGSVVEMYKINMGSRLILMRVFVRACLVCCRERGRPLCSSDIIWGPSPPYYFPVINLEPAVGKIN